MTIKPGEVYRVDLGISGKVRLMVVLSRQDPDAPRALSVCAPITTAFRESNYEVELPHLAFLRAKSWVNLQGVQAIQNHELSRKPIGMITGSTLEAIFAGIRYLFAFDDQSQ
jgi:mRNA interferase MazF